MSKVNYHLFIPTRGRVSSQWTVESIPAKFHKYVTLVCPKDEVSTLRRNYPTVSVVGQPSKIKSITKKREWICKTFDYDYTFLFDDDLNRIWAYDPDTRKYLQWTERPDLCTNFFKKVLPNLMTSYDGLGLGGRLFSHTFEGGTKENTRICIAYGLSKRAITLLDFNRVADYCDTDYSLQLIKAGAKIAVTYASICQQKGEGLPGGLTDERTKERLAESKRVLVNLHPGIITERKTTDKHPVSDLRVSWSKAKKLAKTHRIFS